MRDDIITLVWPLDATQEEKTDVFATIGSVGQREFFSAAQSGFKAEKKVEVWVDDYNDQPFAIVNGKRYSVYRTFERDDQKIELYLGQKVEVR